MLVVRVQCVEKLVMIGRAGQRQRQKLQLFEARCPYRFGVIFHFYSFLRYAPKNAKAENIENILH